MLRENRIRVSVGKDAVKYTSKINADPNDQSSDGAEVCDRGWERSIPGYCQEPTVG